MTKAERTILRFRLDALATTAAVMVVSDPRLGICVGGTESAQHTAVDLLAGIIRDIYRAGLLLRDDPPPAQEPLAHWYPNDQSRQTDNP